MRVDCKIFSSQPKTRRNCTAWYKHGIVLLQRSELKFPRDLAICMDLEANPGDTLLFNKSRAWITQSCPVQPSNYANSSSKSPTVYSIKQLLTLRKFASKIPQALKNQLVGLGIARSRSGVRAGLRAKAKQLDPRQISARITSLRPNGNNQVKFRGVNNAVLRRIPYQKTFRIPVIFSSNVRSVRNKVEELQYVSECNRADVLCITESWLCPQIPDSAINIPGFNLFRKDHTNTMGDGVCIYLRHDIPCKRLVECESPNVESLWLHLRPHSLPRSISSIILRVVYHSTANGNPENEALSPHSSKSGCIID